MHALIRTVLAAAFIVTALAPDQSKAAQNPLTHYCKHWGAAQLFPHDQAKVKKYALATLDIRLRNGQVYKFPLLYIWKGFELRSQPRVWQQLWTGFATVCAGWPKPAWVQRVQSFRTNNADPLRAQRQAKINNLRSRIQQTQMKLGQVRQQVEASPAYQAITGGSVRWQEAAIARAGYLRQIISLSDTRYVVIGKVTRRSKEGVELMGMAVSLKPEMAPGSVTTARVIYVIKPKSGWVRPNGDVFATGALLQGLVDASNPQLIFGPELSRERLTQVKAAKSELRKTLSVIKNGKSRLEKLYRPVRKLERKLADMRAKLAKLQSK